MGAKKLTHHPSESACIKRCILAVDGALSVVAAELSGRIVVVHLANQCTLLS